MNLGKNFVPTPINIDELVMDFEIGIERMAYVMRVTNPLYPRRYNREGNENQPHNGQQQDAQQKEIQSKANTRSKLRENVIREFNTDKWPPPQGKTEIEGSIKALREALHTEIKTIKKSINPINVPREQREALLKMKKDDKIMIAETDKTNKLCLVDIEFVNQNMEELVRDRLISVDGQNGGSLRTG